MLEYNTLHACHFLRQTLESLIKMNARLSSISLFSKIARENFSQMALLETEISAIKKDILKSEQDVSVAQNKLSSREERLAKLAAITIIFAAITLEAYIYDYAARHFSDAYVKKYIGKMDIKSKWVVVPQLVTGRELSRNRKWFTLLENLISERNSIIHNKSSQIPKSPKDIQKLVDSLQERNRIFPEKARQAIEFLDILIEEMKELDPDEAGWVESSFSASNYT